MKDGCGFMCSEKAALRASWEPVKTRTVQECDPAEGKERREEKMDGQVVKQAESRREKQLRDSGQPKVSTPRSRSFWLVIQGTIKLDKDLHCLGRCISFMY